MKGLPLKQVKINGLTFCVGPDEQARRYAADIIRQISDQGQHPDATVRAFRREAEANIRSGEWSRGFLSHGGKAVDIEVTDAPADAVPTSAVTGAHAMMGEAHKQTAPENLQPALTALGNVVTDYTDGETDPDAETVAWARVLQSALRVLESMTDPVERADSPTEAEYAGELLAIAARDLTEATNALPAGRQPVGWDRNPGGRGSRRGADFRPEHAAVGRQCKCVYRAPELGPHPDCPIHSAS